jgi:hypothetical protein
MAVCDGFSNQFADRYRAVRGGEGVFRAPSRIPGDACLEVGRRSVVAPAGDARLRARPERARASAGDAGTAPRDTPAHADFADFARLHPDIEMEILSSGELANLTNREADVAIRVVYDRKTLPLNLHGLVVTSHRSRGIFFA